MQPLYTELEKGIWFGCAAVGFAILFNVPVRTLIMIYLIGAAGGLTKVLMIHFFGVSVVVGAFLGAVIIGVLSIPAAHNKHSPPMVFAIPAAIPMIPGIFAYRLMLGLIKLAGDPTAGTYAQTMADTVNNGLKAMFIVLALAGGVAIPMLVTRKESAKEIRLRKRNNIDMEVE